jgi:predicted ATPase
VQREGLVLAERNGHPFTLAHATTMSAMIFLLEEDWEGAGKLAARAADLSDEYGFARWLGTAQMVRGRVLVEEGDDARGLEEMREGLAALRQAGLRLGESLLISFLAGACLRTDRPDEGLAAVDEGLAYCRETTGRFFEPELWRLRGELILQRAQATASTQPAETQAAEECFEQARAIARSQGAHMLKRRAVRREPAANAVRRKAR